MVFFCLFIVIYIYEYYKLQLATYNVSYDIVVPFQLHKVVKIESSIFKEEKGKSQLTQSFLP